MATLLLCSSPRLAVTDTQCYFALIEPCLGCSVIRKCITSWVFLLSFKIQIQQAASTADLSSLCAHLLRTLESRQSEAPGHSLTHVLPVINSVLTHSPECLTEGIQVNTLFLLKFCCWLKSKYNLFCQICQWDLLPSADHVILLSKKFVDWLRYASITQGGGATTGGFFAGPRSRQVCLSLSHSTYVVSLIHIFIFTLLSIKNWLATSHTVNQQSKTNLNLQLTANTANLSFLKLVSNGCC